MKFVIKLLKNLRETERVLVITQLWNMSKPCFNRPSKTLLHLPHPQHLIRQSKQIVQFFKWPVSHVKGKILTCNFRKLTRSLQWDPLSMSRCAVWRLQQMVRIGRASVYCKIGPGMPIVNLCQKSWAWVSSIKTALSLWQSTNLMENPAAASYF